MQLVILCLHSVTLKELRKALEPADLETLRNIIVAEEGLTRSVDFLGQENILIMLNVNKGDLNADIVWQLKIATWYLDFMGN